MAETPIRLGAQKDPSLDEDIKRAEEILHDLAGELRCMSLHKGTSSLHVRALQLKREVARWRGAGPAEAFRRAAIAELVELRRVAKALRAK